METARALRERRSGQFPLRIQARTDWPLPGANTLQLDGSHFYSLLLISGHS